MAEIEDSGVDDLGEDFQRLDEARMQNVSDVEIGTIRLGPMGAFEESS